MQLDLYFKFPFKNVAATDKIPIATIFMRGKAQSQIAFKLQRYFNSDIKRGDDEKEKRSRRQKKVKFEDYEFFKKRIYNIFKLAN